MPRNCFPKVTVLTQCSNQFALPPKAKKALEEEEVPVGCVFVRRYREPIGEHSQKNNNNNNNTNHEWKADIRDTIPYSYKVIGAAHNQTNHTRNVSASSTNTD